MSASYQPVIWNRQKRIFDVVLTLCVTSYLLIFTVVTLIYNPEVTQETLIIRGTGTLAILMLHVILAIGPLTRINRKFIPLLYNRRHLGVAMFFIGSIHGILSIIQFHALGNVNPIISLFTSNQHYESFTRYPFEVLGFFGLLIFFLMAATSHDFWLHNLGPSVWKLLHMTVYVAYVLIILHVLLGVLQYETSPVLLAILGTAMVGLMLLHGKTSLKERAIDNEKSLLIDGYVKVCDLDLIPDNRARVICAGTERIAIFKYGHKVSALSNVCKHQLGPLGEGKIIDGCVTCPWHGYQYLPHNGTSPPPFKEKVVTYDVKIVGKTVWVNPIPYSEGTERLPATF